MYKVVAAALPPPEELDKLSFDAILGRYTGTVVVTAKSIWIDLADADVEEIVFPLSGVEDVPRPRGRIMSGIVDLARVDAGSNCVTSRATFGDAEQRSR